MKQHVQKRYLLTCLFLLLLTDMYADKSNKVIATINTGVTPAGIAITPNGHTAYIANNNNYGITGQNSVSVLKLKNNTVKTTIFDASFNQPYTVTINPDGDITYITNSNSTTITIIDIATIDVGIQPAGIAITPDGHLAYVTNYNTLYAGANFTDLTPEQGTINITNTKKRKVVPPTIAVGQSHANIAISQDGEYAYVTNYTSNTVNVIELPDC